MKIRWQLISSLVSLMAAASAWAGDSRNFDYLARIPATGLTCVEEAALMSIRFATATKLPVTGSSCKEVIETTFDGAPARIYSLLITYRAENVPHAYVARFEPGGTSPSGSLPGYASYAACVSELPTQVEAFQTETGLVAVSAGCEVARSAISGYAAQIAGFGDNARSLHSFTVAFYGRMDADAAIEAKSILESQGARIVRDLGATFYYYAASPASIRQHQFGFFSDPAECRAQMGSAESILRRSGSSRALVRCAPGDWSTSMDGLADGSAILHGRSGLSVRYFSFAGCMEDRERVLTEAAISHTAVYGAICERDPYAPEGIYRMSLYAR